VNLGIEAAKEWKRVASELWSANLLAVVDGATLENYCRLVGLTREAEATLQREGAQVQSESGAPRSHPALKVILACAPLIRQYADALGLNARARGYVEPLAAETDNRPDRFFDPLYKVGKVAK